MYTFEHPYLWFGNDEHNVHQRLVCAFSDAYFNDGADDQKHRVKVLGYTSQPEFELIVKILKALNKGKKVEWINARLSQSSLRW